MNETVGFYIALLLIVTCVVVIVGQISYGLGCLKGFSKGWRDGSIYTLGISIEQLEQLDRDTALELLRKLLDKQAEDTENLK